MSTDESFMEYVADQVDLGDRLTYKKMFGEYGVYVDGVFTALACDNSLFVKPTSAVEELGADLPARPPYPRGKPHPVVDELLDDPETLRGLLVATAALLPKPKPGRSGSRRAGR